MFESKRPFRWLVAALAALGAGVAAPAQPAAAPARPAVEAPAEGAPKFIRVVESDGGARVRMEVVIRHFEPADGEGPAVDLVGAAHIGDGSFYERLQQHLDAKDVVLFEGVKPAAAERVDGEAATDEDRAERTRKRIRMIASIAEAYHDEKGEYPESIDRLAAAKDKRIAWLASTSSEDGWGRPLIYAAEPGSARGIELLSLGADGEKGGEGAAADIAWSSLPPLGADEKLSDDPGIQSKLASALGLKFQLDVMDHSGDNWRNSDMSVDQLQEKLEEAGVSGAGLFKMLDGSSFQARALSFVLGFIERDPSMGALVKVMLVEMLADADRILAAAPGDMGRMMDVIVRDRNTVVMDDLGAIIAGEPDVESVGIIYGAGHLPDLQRRLTEELGYKVTGEQWVPAIEVDLKAAGVSVRQAQTMRAMIRRSMEQQLRMMDRQRAGRAGAAPVPAGGTKPGEGSGEEE
jgi:general secretion pathway protein G